jgi:argininosuccinate synthase
VGGKETLTSHLPLPETAWPTQKVKAHPLNLCLNFMNGEPVGINQRKFENPVSLITELNNLLSPYGIGRDIHVGDTIIGIKGRVGFESAAAILLIKSHQMLEKHTLTKWQIFWKDQLSTWYGNWLHEGQFLDPVMRDLENFFVSSQKTVNGKVFVKITDGSFVIVGIESENDLMSSEFGCYGEINKTWTGDDVKGFTKIFGNQVSIWHQVNSKSFELQNFQYDEQKN